MTISTKTSRLGRAMALGLTAALIGGASLFGATAAQAAPGDTYSVTGEVQDGAGAPLAGVNTSIRIPGVGGDSDTVIGRTSAGDGSFTLPGIPAGSYTVELTLDGYGYKSLPVTVVAADVALATVTMLPNTDASGATATISGTGLVGDPLKVTTTGWPAGATFTYQWFAPIPEHSSGDITGATTDTYVVTADVIGRDVFVWVDGSVPGVSAPSEITSSNHVAAFAAKKPTGAAPADTTGSTPAAQTSAGLPAGALDPGKDQTASVTWAAADSFVDVYVFSTPTLLGTFPVVNGVAQITLSKAVLAKLSTGTHTLVITGQTSGAVQSVTLALGLAVTGADDPTVPLTVASLLLLLGAGLLITRRRIGQKA